MRGVISQKHLSLNRKLSMEINRLARSFNEKAYSKIGDIDGLLLKSDISVEKKKNILAKKLHENIVRAFSINKSKFKKRAFESLKKRLSNIRKIIIKLRSINYYLETAFLEELRLFGLTKIKPIKETRLLQPKNLAKDELEMLEYSTYRLISNAAILDKKLIKGYSAKEKKVVEKEKTEAKYLDLILKKESRILEHLEAKLPPPKAATMQLTREPTFTHWASRVLALLVYFEHMHINEKWIFSQLRKNKKISRAINKKIIQLAKENSRLISIMRQKAASMKLRNRLHRLTTIANL